MGNTLSLFIALNSSVLLGLLWGITFLAGYLHLFKHDLQRERTFECGYHSFQERLPTNNVYFWLSSTFIVLYDVELILYIPGLFNWFFAPFHSFLLYILLGLVVIASFLVDIDGNLIFWFLH